MTLRRSTLCSAFVCLFLIGSALAATPATELLYVQQGQNVITYSVNTKTAVSRKLGTLPTAYTGSLPIIINRSGNFLYICWAVNTAKPGPTASHNDRHVGPKTPQH